jgi:hypothetical protein
MDEKYGGKHPMQTEQTMENFKSAMRERHGVDFAMQKPEFRAKSSESFHNHSPSEMSGIRDRIRSTCMERYGVDNYVKTPDYKSKCRETCMRKYGVDHVSKSKQYRITKHQTMFHKFMTSDRFKNFTPMFSLDEYNGVGKDFNKPYMFKCKRCNHTQSYDLSDGNSVDCPNCDKNGSSYFQKEVWDHIKSIMGNDFIVLNNDRRILYPKEIDLYIPSESLAIECDGLYWHSEVTGHKNKVYHLNKMKQCMMKGIRLIHIFENEWNYSQPIVKSILSNILHRTKRTLYARKCRVVEISDKSISRRFLVQNHIQGDDKSSVKLGLMCGDELVSVMTFSKSRFDKNVQYEMARYCSLLDTTIVGGAGKLFTHFVRTYNPISIVSYNDLRYFDGRVYANLGFKSVLNTSPSYHYIVDGYKTTKGRMTFQKHKLSRILPNFDASLTEWENMKNNGMDRIWDCGHTKWIWQRSTTVTT